MTSLAIDELTIEKLRKLYCVHHRPGLGDCSTRQNNVAAWFSNFDERLEESIFKLDPVHGYPVIHLAPYLRRMLQITKASERLQRVLNKYDRKNGCHNSSICQDHVKFLDSLSCYTEVDHGGSGNLIDVCFDRDFEYLICKDEKTDETLIAISLHTGMDIRFGWTHYECFCITGPSSHEYRKIDFLYPVLVFCVWNEFPPVDETFTSFTELEHFGGVWDKEKQAWFYMGCEVSVRCDADND